MSTRWNKRNFTLKIEEMVEATSEKSSADNYLNFDGIGRQEIEGELLTLPSVLWAGTAPTMLTSEVQNTIIAEIITAEKIGVEWDGFATTSLDRSCS